MKDLIREIHRRSLWQVLAIFAGASWFVLQVVDVFIERGMAPDWVFTAALLLLLIGLPVVLATAFVQEGHPGKAGLGARASDEGPAADAAVAERSATVVEEGTAAEGVKAAAVVASREELAGAADPSPGAKSESVSKRGRPGLADRLTWNRAILGGVLAFAALGVVAAGYMAMRTLGIGAPGTLVAQGLLEEGAQVVLADFDSPSDPELGNVVTQALRIDLFQSPTLRVVEQADLSDALARMQRDEEGPLTVEAATELAEREGYPVVVAGDVGTAGAGYLLTARILGGQGWRSLAAFRQTAKSEDDLIGAIERLSRDIRDKAGESLRSVQGGPSLSRVSTSSLEALRAYTRGAELEDTDLAGALEAFERAVELDSAFAMAYRKIGVALSNMGTRRADQVRVTTRAFELRDRLPERERHLAEAWYHDLVTGDAEATARAYERAIEADSLGTAALNNLGLRYMARGRFDEAEALFARALDVSSFAVAWLNLARARFWQGRYAEAEATLDSAIASLPEADQLRAWKAGAVGSARDYARFDSLLADYERRATERFDRDFGVMLRAQAAALRGRLRDAQSGLNDFETDAFRDPLALSAGHARASLQRGDTAMAVRLVEEALVAHRDSLEAADRSYGALIPVLWEARAREAATALLDEWAAAVPEDQLGVDGRPVRLRATAQVAMLNGELDRAVDILEDLRRDCPGFCEPATSYNLARAFELMADTASAVREYERYLGLHQPGRILSASFREPHALRRLAALYDARGDLEKAAEYYARFVELWAAADEELQPRVRAAQARLEEIVRERG